MTPSTETRDLREAFGAAGCISGPQVGPGPGCLVRLSEETLLFKTSPMRQTSAVETVFCVVLSRACLR